MFTTKMRGTVFFIFGLFCHVPVLPVVAYANETLLRSTLKNAYDTFSRPSMPTTVEVSYNLRSLQSLDITAQSMTHTGWFIIRWHDPRLIWSPGSYSNITDIEVNWAWRPEFVLSNSMDRGGFVKKGLDDEETRMTVFYDGTVRWSVDISLMTSCDVHPAKFPFDEQECVMEATFLGHNYDNAFQLNLSQTEVYTSNIMPNGEWVYTSSWMQINVAPMCCPSNTIGYISTYMKFQRLRPFYVINLLLPAILLSLCMTWAFIIPTACGERLGYTLTILLSYTVLLTITSQLLPTTSQETPYIATYLLGVLVFCTLAVFNVAINVQFYFLEDKPSRWVRRLCAKLHPIVYFEWCKSTKVENLNEGNGVHEVVVEDLEAEKPSILHQMTQHESDTVSVTTQDSSEHVTYKDFSVLLDRICFYVYLLAVVCVTIWLFVKLTGN